MRMVASLIKLTSAFTDTVHNIYNVYMNGFQLSHKQQAPHRFLNHKEEAVKYKG